MFVTETKVYFPSTTRYKNGRDSKFYKQTNKQNVTECEQVGYLEIFAKATLILKYT